MRSRSRPRFNLTASRVTLMLTCLSRLPARSGPISSSASLTAGEMDAAAAAEPRLRTELGPVSERYSDAHNERRARRTARGGDPASMLSSQCSHSKRSLYANASSSPGSRTGLGRSGWRDKVVLSGCCGRYNRLPPANWRGYVEFCCHTHRGRNL